MEDREREEDGGHEIQGLRLHPPGEHLQERTAFFSGVALEGRGKERFHRDRIPR
jgi:hypothetical protein